MALTTSYSKAETDIKLNRLKQLFGSGLHPEPLKINDPTPTELGGYILADVGTYSFGNTESGKWNVGFLSSGGWDIISIELPESESTYNIFKLSKIYSWNFNNGEIQDVSDLIGSSNKISVVAGDSFYVGNLNTTVNRCRLLYYSASGVFIKSYDYYQGSFVTIPEGVGLVAIDIWATSGDKSTINTEAIEFIKITEFDNVKNTFILQKSLSWNFNNGNPEAFDDSLGSFNKIKVSEGESYALPKKDDSISVRRLIFYDFSDNYVSSILYVEESFFTIPIGVKFVALVAWATSGNKNTIERLPIYLENYKKTDVYEKKFVIHPSLGYNFNTGEQDSFADMLGSSNKLEAKEGLSYRLSTRNSTINRTRILQFTSSGVFVKSYEYEIGDIFKAKITGLVAIDIWATSGDKSTIIRDYINFIEVPNTDEPEWAAAGDSITGGNLSNSEDAISYATLAANRLGVKLQKLGYWGQKMDHLQNVYNDLNDNVSVLTVFFGHNDYITNWDSKTIDQIMAVPFAQLGTAGYQTSFEWLRWFLETMRKNKPNVYIIVLTPLIRSGDTYPITIQKQHDFAAAEIELCKRLGNHCIDIQNSVPIRGDDVYQETEGNAGDYYHVHLKHLGKKLVANRLLSEVSFANIFK